jgi:hypothetical protein
MSRAARFILALFLAAAGASGHGAGVEGRYELSEHGFLRMRVPDGWLDEVRERAPQAPPTIVFRPLLSNAEKDKDALRNHTLGMLKSAAQVQK